MLINVEIPDRFEHLASRQEWQCILKQYSALMHFSQHTLSLDDGAELAGMDIGSFIKLCDQHNIPVIDYNEGEFEAEKSSIPTDLI
ncbi:MAG: hypothetical protein CVV27_07190 [Candidatus Melainabacteria bacterium HGW-Melainabacteria-1]|nr:MAG: hypothetical protein CVV27_07190 [Candidatus Melainabacteria bacterium HGW-Melainabacteria-1]